MGNVRDESEHQASRSIELSEEWADHGRVGPEYWTPGEGGKYGIQYDGDTPGGNVWEFMRPSAVSNTPRVDEISEIIDSWESYCRAYLRVI